MQKTGGKQVVVCPPLINRNEKTEVILATRKVLTWGVGRWGVQGGPLKIFPILTRVYRCKHSSFCTLKIYAPDNMYLLTSNFFFFLK